MAALGVPPSRHIRRAPGIGADAGERFVGYGGVHLFAELTWFDGVIGIHGFTPW